MYIQNHQNKLTFSHPSTAIYTYVTVRGEPGCWPLPWWWSRVPLMFTSSILRLKINLLNTYTRFSGSTWNILVVTITIQRRQAKGNVRKTRNSTATACHQNWDKYNTKHTTALYYRLLTSTSTEQYKISICASVATNSMPYNLPRTTTFIQELKCMLRWY
jgi:hypothetical protein